MRKFIDQFADTARRFIRTTTYAPIRHGQFT
jgi:hypothetical protein